MFYYTHNVGEFAALTRMMSLDEIGLAMILIDEFVRTERPIAYDTFAMYVESLASREQVANESLTNRYEKRVLRRIFVETPDGWTCPMIAEQLKKYEARAEVNRANAKRSRKKKEEEHQVKPDEEPQRVATDSLASREQVASESLTTENSKPRTVNQRIESTDVLSTQAQAPASTPVRRRKTSGVSSVEKPDEIPAQVWSDWLQIRKAKRLPLTKTAWDAMLVEAEKVGYSAEEMVRCCVEHGWASFKAQWLINEREKNERAAGMPPKANRPLQRQDLEDLEEVPL